MKPLAPLSENVIADQARRAAARVGIHYHIRGVYLVTHDGGESEDREATEAELAMWHALVGPIEDVLGADLREFEKNFWGPGPFYLSAEDLTVLRRSMAFNPNFDSETIRLGFFGTFREVARIYVSRAIPKGYYLNVDRVVPELNWRPASMARELAPELDVGLRCELEMHLRPLMA